MRKPSLMKIIFTLIQRHNFDLAMFLGTYGGVFKVRNFRFKHAEMDYFCFYANMKIYLLFSSKLISCLLRGALKTNQPESVAAPAGFLAGLSSMALFRSTSITIYTAWKTIDVSLSIILFSNSLLFQLNRECSFIYVK